MIHLDENEDSWLFHGGLKRDTFTDCLKPDCLKPDCLKPGFR